MFVQCCGTGSAGGDHASRDGPSTARKVGIVVPENDARLPVNKAGTALLSGTITETAPFPESACRTCYPSSARARTVLDA